jgi:hypothetical protein
MWFAENGPKVSVKWKRHAHSTQPQSPRNLSPRKLAAEIQ